MDGLLMRAQKLMARGEFALASEMLRHHVMEEENPSLKVLNLLGICEARQGNREMAREMFTHVLSRSPGNAAALTNLGNLAFLEGDHHLAREFYTKALRQNVLLSEPRFNIVLSYQDMGHFEKAMTAYENYRLIAQTAKWSRLILILGLTLLLLFLLRR